ncbi:hypothetical protein N8865_02705 [Francisellaceae bacterium]|nr:hypothetical protein [Francisellaceae bacterium]
MIKKALLISTLLISINSYGFMDGLTKNVAIKSISDSVSAGSAQTLGTAIATQKLEDIGISNPAEQASWSNFIQDCIIKDNLSAEKVSDLATSGTSGIVDFLKEFKAPDFKTVIQDKIMSCKHALPMVQKIVGAALTKSTSSFF